MSITEYSIKNQVVIWLGALIIAIGGIASYFTLGKLEDPEFTIKTAIIVTEYPGAGPVEVEQEITEQIEIALQEVAEIDYVESISRAGLSIVKVEVGSQYWTDELPQIWDSLRRKIRNIEQSLPQGAKRPHISDDFGDVYGFVIAITGDGFTYKELESEVKNLKRKLSLVDDVARIEFWGKQNQAIYLKIKESRLRELRISEADLKSVLNTQNTLIPSGNVYYDSHSARIEVTGPFSNIEDIRNLVVKGRDAIRDEIITIRDIAEVTEAPVEPAIQTMRFNGKPAIALAISNMKGSNILTLGDNLENRIQELQAEIPVGINIHKVAWQADEVEKAIDSFIVSLIEAVAIVLVVLTVFMGWRMGVIIGTALILTILGTLVFMAILGIDLQRMSLGALVIALGMMVDNAIVVGDGVVAKMKKGMKPFEAALDSARGPSLPLLGATIIAILAFYPIGGSKEDVGEYCLSLFQVVGISLLFSWIVSMTVTPLQCLLMIKPPKRENHSQLYDGALFRWYKFLLEKSIRHRKVTLSVMIVVLIISAWGFQYVQQMFFPDSARPQFMIDMYATTGTRISESSAILETAEEYIAKLDGVQSVSTFVGSGPPRFYLPVEPELFFPSYGQLIVNVDDHKKIDSIASELRLWLKESFPEVPTFRVRKYGVGPAETWKFELRITAPPDATPSEIRKIGEKGLAIVNKHPFVADSTTDWRQKVPKVVIEYDQNKGKYANVNRQDLSSATQRVFDGLPLGEFRQNDELLPILLRNSTDERESPNAIYSIQLRQQAGTRPVPLSQVTESIGLQWEDPFIWRRDRHRLITVQAEPIPGVTLNTLLADITVQLDEFEESMPVGYKMELGAEAESAADAQASLIPGTLPAMVIMFFIIVALFNELKPALIIFLTLPLILIGISVGLLITGAPFGFMALLGALSLMGMMIKNAIVLLDEIKLNIVELKEEPYEAIIKAGLSRLNPVALAAATTILGVIPLIQDVFWVSMAVTIMSGLAFGTVLTMIVVPVLYCIFYNVRIPNSSTI